jgi:predicted O-linked N-acetylglucosamine transferase (SPINDLY family)
MGIVAAQPAPIQVNYLGYPGTMGAPFMDYIIADRVVVPDSNRAYYSEKIIYLPHTYQPNDSRRPTPAQTISRAEAELPVSGFVFCCFNNTRKITFQVFEVWMRLLNACPESVLWLLGDNSDAINNLRREAGVFGIAPSRLVFTPRTSPDSHLARHLLADLFLDTLPYSAHTTASDALWMGLPVLSCMGNTFSGRVAASLLYAIGLPELVTTSLSEYEELAVTLARGAERLSAVKARLMLNRKTSPLFDTKRYTRNLETAFAETWIRHQNGKSPESFAVAELE